MKFDKTNVGRFKVEDLKTAASNVCLPEHSLELSNAAEVENKNNDAFCMDLGFMYSLLNFGYNLTDDRVVHTTKKIDNIEIGWSLGAAIQFLDVRMEEHANRQCGF